MASFSALVRDLARNPTILIFEIFSIVVLSVLFEGLEAWFHKKLKKDQMGLALMDVLFKEITLIGFVAFVLFISLHTGFAASLAEDYPLIASFETVRMLMFMVVNMLILQAVALWLGGQRIIKEWGEFERARSFGKYKYSLENRLIRSGYLKTVPDKTGKRDRILELNRRWEFGSNFFVRMTRVLSRSQMRKLLILRAIRHEFLFPSVDNVARVPDPSVFSFESYLAKRLGKTLVALITVDSKTWLSTLALLTVPLYSFRYRIVSWVKWEEAYLCFFSWLLVIAGCVLICFLEEDTYRMTPVLPRDLRLTLKIFHGESVQMLRRAAMPSWKGSSRFGRRYRPGLGEAESAPPPKLKRALAMRSQAQGGRGRLLNSQTYIGIGRLLSHFQAIVAAALIVVHISAVVEERIEWVLYALSWGAWLFNMYYVLPLILRRITILSSIEYEKDERAIRVTTLEFKDALFQDFQRLVQLLGFEHRAVEAGEAWTLPDGRWGRREQIKAVVRGNRLFDSLGEDDKMQIWHTFAAWDAKNDGVADGREVEEAFKLMEFANADHKTVANLVRLVDFDGTGELNWMKFKGLFGIATVKRPKEELVQDLSYWFKLLDSDNNNVLSLVELAAGFRGMSISLSAVDIENLLFTYYGVAKPEITLDEFVAFISADNRMSSIRAFYDYGSKSVVMA